jgi:hypothetical protein
MDPRPDPHVSPSAGDAVDRPPDRDRDPAPGAGATITVCPNGPLLVRGPVVLVTPDGTELPRRRRTLALCRCGGSGRPPLCDGTHRAIGYRSG